MINSMDNRTVRKQPSNKKRSSKKKRLLKKGLLIYVFDFFKDIVNNIKKFIYSDAIKSKKSKLILTCSIIIFILTLFTYNITKKNAYAVSIGDTFICYTELSKNLTVESLKESALAKLKSDYGTNVETTAEIKLKKVHVNKKKNTVKDAEDTSQDVINKLTYSINATQILVNDLVLATLKNKAESDAVLDKIKNSYAQDGAENVNAEFLEPVKTSDALKSPSEVDSIDKAYEALTAKKESDITHNVSKGETLSLIANKYNMLLEDVISLNPNINPNNIKIGQLINVRSSKPVLSVSVSYDIVNKEPLEFATEQKENPMQSKKYKNVLQQGENGEKIVTTRITKVDGVITSEEEINSVIQKEAIPEIIEVGTK